jgi:osmotically-inducible protein OsmY
MTDLELKRAVESELEWNPSIKSPAAIGVGVKDGIVTLSGHVDSYFEKVEAERAATRVLGVDAVVNELEVQLPSSSERTDEDIARAALNILKWTEGVPLEQIKVTVDDGWIKLKGSVDWDFQKRAAEDALRSMTGIKGITNLIEVHPSVGKAVIKSSIEQALKRQSEIEAQRIQVETIGSKVILRGTVRSLFEKKEAERVVWKTPGVTEVENVLEVVNDVSEDQRRVS